MLIFTRFFIPSVFVLLCAFFQNIISAQGNYKFGKIDKADLAQTAWPSDTSAAAAILHHGNTFFIDLQNDGWLVQDVDRRVQLFKKSAFDLANIKIYFRPDIEEVSTLKAAIHLPNGETIKLKNKDFIKEEFTEGVRMFSFTFPQVTEGAIFEYTYRKRTTDYRSLPTFYFQEEYPVRWSEFRADIPEYLNFVNFMPISGNWAISKAEDESRVSTTGIPVQYRVLHYAMKDVVAYRAEPYSNNEMDYIPHSTVQLVSIILPQRAPINYITSWKGLAKSLDDDDPYFGRKFNQLKDFRQAFNEIFSKLIDAKSEKDKAAIIYQTLAVEMNWDERYGIKTDNDLNDCWVKRSGSSEEINMLLLGMLKQLNIEAQPVLVSLRGRGNPITAYPIYEQFDHMMVWANLDGEETLLDVNDPLRKMGLPRFDALNGQGWVADPENPRWIDLNVNKMNRTVLSDIEVAANGMAKVKMRGRLNGYYAQNGRYLLRDKEEEWEGPLMNTVIEHFPEASFLGREVKATEDNAYAPLELNLELIAELGMVSDDYMYLNPVVLPSLDKRLKDSERRITPVDMGYPWKERYLANVIIPEGYVLEELPANQRFQSEDGNFVVKYTAVEGDGTIKISYTVDVGKAVFPANVYAGLRALFAKAIDLQESLIVLKKTN